MSGERSAIPEPPTTTMRFKLGFVLLVPLLLLASAVKSGVDELGFRLLRAKTTGEVIEYEFKEDGKLLAYVYTLDDSESGPNVRFEHLTPRFQVFSYKWRLAGQTLFLLMGKNEMKVDSADWHRSGELVQFGELTFRKVDRLEFFDNLHAYAGKNFVEAKPSK
jgi:hypothetical protein